MRIVNVLPSDKEMSWVKVYGRWGRVNRVACRTWVCVIGEDLREKETGDGRRRVRVVDAIVEGLEVCEMGLKCQLYQ